MSIPHEIQSDLRCKPPGEAVLAALKQLLKEDDHLLRIDANERSITFRFGMYLQKELPNYHIDCEYNRNCLDTKQIEIAGRQTSVDDTEGKRVFPDVIAHIRGDGQNYLVIEFKKSSNPADRERDLNKLRAYKEDEQLRYEYALFIELTVGAQPGIACAKWID